MVTRQKKIKGSIKKMSFWIGKTGLIVVLSIKISDEGRRSDLGGRRTKLTSFSFVYTEFE